ncbi:unnamed protein product [Lepeophtheirus salmonis]|uniref:(salmon louse) hypothetical protein n=1 Tax=Lepeophtheirus salmonis TaxID=72036 RepID=A0A7R8H915_LEPSM|nr:unnamed protein product [Lepeophtheirus salmonis]CAF2933770.1 unnamed protein product [Lepeophtheirus salmonis]
MVYRKTNPLKGDFKLKRLKKIFPLLLKISCSTGIISFVPSSANYTDTESAKRVSFHSDVDVKRISSSVPSLITSETSINNAILLAEEAKLIFAKLNTIPENNLKSIEKLNYDYMSQKEHLQGRYFGLDALQDLDNAVNGSPPPPSESSSSYRADKKKNNSNYHYDHPSDGSRRRGRDSDFMSTTEETSSERQGSYSNKNHSRDSPYRSPTRTYFTDTEILRSPTEVLYAVSDKNPDDDESNIVHSSSQTLQSELMKRRDSHPHLYKRDPHYDSYSHSKRKGINPLMSQSLDSYIEEDKENSYKTRIHVISSLRSKEMEPMDQEAGYYDANGHYKVPRNKPLYNTRHQPTDSDSSARYYISRRGGNPGDANNNNFASTRLVKHIETSRSDRDREGREISRRNGRTYSGCSTSPDREGSNERYSRPKPVRSYSNLTYHSLHHHKDRSPSSSPTRPYRSKSSQNRDERSKGGYYRPSSKNQINGSSTTLERHRKTSSSDEEYSNYDSVTSSTRRRSSVVVAHNNKYNEELVARERGQSLPPGATIDSMEDFYKSNQYKSMYTLPPSPNRPAPILDRVSGNPNGTINRKERSKNRIDMDEIYTDDSTKISRPKLKDPNLQDLSPPRQHHYSNGAKIQIKRGTSPLDSRDESVVSNGRRVTSVDRNGHHHPSRRAAYSNRRRQSVDGTLDSSYSESDGMIGDNDQDRPIKKEYAPGRRYISGSGNSDLDSDYRRELATQSSRPPSTLNRSKKNEGSTSNLTTKSLDRRYRERHPIPGEIKRKLSPPSREEERRKVLEIERIHRQTTQQQQQEQQIIQQQRSTPSRSGSRLGRVLGLGSKKTRHLSSDGDSQYTGGGRGSPPKGSVSSTSRSNSVPKINRYDQNIRGVKRNSSSSHVGVRREIHNRKKIPGSLTSSINSSESEGAGSGKAIILHNTAVAEIPIPKSGGDVSRRTLSESREKFPNGHHSHKAINNVNLQKSQKISRSISLLTPWKPRNYKDKFEAQRGKSPGKPPRPPSASRQVHSSRTGTMQRDKKSASSSDLLRDETPPGRKGPPPPRASSRIETSEPKHKPLTTTNSKVSRSVSMPKNTRLSGWFKKRK